jgi:5-methylcytosine-specific restriction endonuclease McrA
VARGEIHLGAIHLLANHLTEENHAGVLGRARHKSSREVEGLVAELAPRPDVASRIRAMPGLKRADTAVEGGAENRLAGSRDEDRTNSEPAGNATDQLMPRTAAKPVVALSPRRYKIEITVDEATHDKLRSLQDLLGRSRDGRDPAAIISRAIDVLLVRTLTRKAGCTDRPNTTAPANERCTDRPGTMASAKAERSDRRSAADSAAARGRERSRSIPAAVRREVWRRDSGCCCYFDARGCRCGETSNIEFHHKDPFATGGQHTPQNIELRCVAHNQYQADLDFGRSFMDGKRSSVRAARTFPGECHGRRAAP